MVGLFILVLTTIAMLGAVGYAALSNIDVVQRVSAVQENLRALDAAYQSIRLASVDTDGTGVWRVPAGQLSAGGYTTLPSWLTGQNVSASGAPLLYCPFSASPIISPTTGTVNGAEDYLYNIVTINNARTGGHDYVQESDSPPVPGVLAIIVAPVGDGGTPPSCSDLVLSDGRWRVPGGVTRVLTSGQTQESALSVAAHEIVWHVAPAPAGDESGRDSGNPSTLARAMATWVAHRPSTMVIHLAMGVHSVAPSDLDLSSHPSSDYEERRLRFRGAGSGVTSVAGATTIAVPGASLTVEGVNLGGRLVATNGDVSLSDVVAGGLTTQGADVSAQAVGIIGSSASPAILASGSRLSFFGGQSIDASGHAGAVRLEDAFLSVNGGAWSISVASGYRAFEARERSSARVQDATVSVTGGAGSYVLVDRDSSFSSRNSTWTADSVVYGLEVTGGSVTVDGGLLSLPGATYGAWIRGGGRLELRGGASLGEVAGLPSVGIKDDGGINVSGASADVYAGTCWEGEAFAQSPSGPGLISTPIETAAALYRIVNSSAWLCH